MRRLVERWLAEAASDCRHGDERRACERWEAIIPSPFFRSKPFFRRLPRFRRLPCLRLLRRYSSERGNASQRRDGDEWRVGENGIEWPEASHT